MTKFDMGFKAGQESRHDELGRLSIEITALKEVNNKLSKDMAIMRTQLIGTVQAAKTVVDLLTAAGVEQWANQRR